MSTLKAVGVQDILIKRRSSFAIDPEKIDCDYYNFQKGDIRAINAYVGDYMPSYSWAEFTVGYLDQIRTHIPIDLLDIPSYLGQNKSETAANACRSGRNPLKITYPKHPPK